MRTPDRRGERRALYESILEDERASHAERLKADELLAGLEQDERRAAKAEQLTEAEVMTELASLAEAAPTWLAIARGPDLVEAPIEVDDLEGLIDLQQRVLDLQSLVLADRERALQDRTVQRRLPKAPGAVIA